MSKSETGNITFDHMGRARFRASALSPDKRVPAETVEAGCVCHDAFFPPDHEVHAVIEPHATCRAF